MIYREVIHNGRKHSKRLGLFYIQSFHHCSFIIISIEQEIATMAKDGAHAVNKISGSNGNKFPLILEINFSYRKCAEIKALFYV